MSPESRQITFQQLKAKQEVKMSQGLRNMTEFQDRQPLRLTLRFSSADPNDGGSKVFAHVLNKPVVSKTKNPYQSLRNETLSTFLSVSMHIHVVIV